MSYVRCHFENTSGFEEIDAYTIFTCKKEGGDVENKLEESTALSQIFCLQRYTEIH